MYVNMYACSDMTAYERLSESVVTLICIKATAI